MMKDLVKDVDRLVSCLATKVYRHIPGYVQLELVFLTFQIKRLAHAVMESILNILITELLVWLLDERVPLMDDGSQLLKALNVLMLKILDNAERTLSLVMLINLLRPLDPSKWPLLVSGSPQYNI
ncbi:protein MOR1 isoform X1 [Amborella trichopoda]|nr:protein MOR1 isoform X1 [Amborella trichopoda]|eukprot:XP_006847369.2 protein MOR1 isoform X1 [Amborella trichopoda]